jgi:hypothetical protein
MAAGLAVSAAPGGFPADPFSAYAASSSRPGVGRSSAASNLWCGTGAADGVAESRSQLRAVAGVQGGSVQQAGVDGSERCASKAKAHSLLPEAVSPHQQQQHQQQQQQEEEEVDRDRGGPAGPDRNELWQYPNAAAGGGVEGLGSAGRRHRSLVARWNSSVSSRKARAAGAGLVQR